MNAYQWKQTAFGAAVDRGLYNLASQIDETNAADFSGGIPWHIIRAIADEQQRLTPSKSPPERSGTTGHNQTLTRRGKCGIIKAIRRHVCRWKRKQEGKTMTIYGRAITNDDMRNIAEYMDDEIREELHGKLAPCSNEKFLREYIKRDSEILEILRNEFDFSE